jgi:hypothetical protein
VTTLELILAIGLGLALAAVVLLAAVVPQRVARMVRAEHARSDTRALAAKAALHAASSAEVAAIVAPLRAMNEEQERIVIGLRGLLGWLAAFSRAQFEKVAGASAEQPERSPDRLEPSHERRAARAPAVAPPGSTEPQHPEPAQRAAGLTRPAGASKARSEGEARRTKGPALAPGAPWRGPPSAPTLVSMQAITPPAARPAPPVLVEGEDNSGGGGAA